ncbi:MAG: metallophosphoesterase [Lachnospiraceae bacterium]|nr:metallophosphoesterase [Lachnospiraceae bacterium]
MIYVMSDIHGRYDKYREMLSLIRLQDSDTLYVLGDVIDRGDDGIKILQDMMFRPNVIPILGNHEYMAVMTLDWMLKEVTEEGVEKVDEDVLRGLTEWMSVGGDATISALYALSHEEREDIQEYLLEFALCDVVKAGGREFVLVHAGLDHFSPDRDLDDYDVSEMIFQRPDYTKVYFSDKYLVTGHVPTRLIYETTVSEFAEEVETVESRDRIFEKNNHIAIDCGAGFGGRLGCICLDTLEKFYT